MSIKTVAEFREKSCVAPFGHLSTIPNGTCHLCCWFDREPVKNDNGEAFNFNFDRVEEIWQSTGYQKYRTIFLNAGPASLPTCNQICMGHGNNKLSKRNVLNNQFSDSEIQDIIDGKVKPFPKLLEVKLTSLCNLKCQTCGPENSTQFLAEKNPAAEPYLKPFRKAFKIYLDTGALPFLQSILDNLPEVEVLEFYGGEPFMIKDHKWFLNEIIKTGRAKDIHLRYITNGTIYDDDYPSLFREFKSIIISVSVDSLHTKNDFIRLNSKWDDLLANILKFEQMLHNGEIESLNLNTTISVLNVMDYFDFITFFDDAFTKHNRLTLSVSIVHQPDDMQINLIHPKLKAMWKYLKNKFINIDLKTFDKQNVKDVLAIIERKLDE